MKISAEVSNMQHCAQGDTSQGNYAWYSEHGDKLKDGFHKSAKKILKDLATKELGLETSQFDLRTNKAGPASLGETTLHADRVYVQMGGLFSDDILVRSCKHRKDYTGGQNRWFKLSNLPDNQEGFVSLVKACAEAGGQ